MHRHEPVIGDTYAKDTSCVGSARYENNQHVTVAGLYPSPNDNTADGYVTLRKADGTHDLVRRWYLNDHFTYAAPEWEAGRVYCYHKDIAEGAEFRVMFVDPDNGNAYVKMVDKPQSIGWCEHAKDRTMFEEMTE